MSRSIKDILKRGPRNEHELLLKRLQKLHQEEAPQRVAALLEKIELITQDIQR